MENELDKTKDFSKNDTCTKMTDRPRCRRPSFIDMCQSASKLHGGGQIGSAIDPAIERRRSSSIPELLPAVVVKGSRTSEGCTSKMLLSRQAASAPVVPAAGESGRYGSTDRGECPGALDVDDEDDNPTTATDTDGTSDDVAALRELVHHQKEDLEMAALIGQRLLDSNEELSAKLEAAREEKWLADCEKDALRRDLEHATQRCEQMQRDTAIEVVPASEEPQVEEFDLWSPGATATVGAARASVSEDGSVCPMIVNTPTDAATDHDKEADFLKKTVEKLEQANTTLEEKLVEARLEMTALRRTSVERGEAVLDQETRELRDKEKQRLGASWSAPDAVCGGVNLSVGDDGIDAGLCQDYGEEGRNRWSDIVSGSTEKQEPTPIEKVACSGDNDPSREEKEQVEQDCVGVAPMDNQEGKIGCRTNDNSDGDARKREIMEAATAPASSFRRLSSSAFKDAEEQAELIEALRGQISELRCELQTVRLPNTSAAGDEKRRRGETGSSLYPHVDVGRPRIRSKCSSDDDSGSDRDDGDGGIDRVASDDHGNNTGECKPLCSSCQQPICDEGAISEEGSGGGHRKRGGGDINSRRGDGGDRVDDDPAQLFILRARIDALSAELEVGKLAFEALQQRSQQDQAACLELQRELLRLHGAKDNRTVMVAAVARVSAARTVSPAATHATHHDPGGDDGPESERRSNCLNYHGLGWLQWIWRTVCCRSDEEGGLGSAFEDRSYDETIIGCGDNAADADVGGEVVGDGDGVVEPGDYRDGRGIRRRFLADERASLLAKDKRKIGR